MGYEIKKRETSWGVTHELFMDRDPRAIATLAIDQGSVFGAPRMPAINWSAIGSQPSGIAREFAAGLMELAAIADQHIPKSEIEIPTLCK